MAKTYQYCIICGNAQKSTHNCSRCGSVYLAERDQMDYEVHLFDRVTPGEEPGNIPPNDPKHHDAPTSLPPANRDLRPIGTGGKDVQDTELHDQDPLKNLQSGDRQVVDQVRETWTRTGDPKTTRLTLWDKNVINQDVDPKNYSTKNDGHERPADGPARPEKAVPAPVGGSMDTKETTVAVYPGKPGREQPDAFMDPHAGGPTTQESLEPTMKTPPVSETSKVYPGDAKTKPDSWDDTNHKADYQDNVHKETWDGQGPPKAPPQGSTEDPRDVKADADPHHAKPDVDTRDVKNYKKANDDEDDVHPEGNIDQAKTEAHPDGKAPPAPIKPDSHMDPHTSKPSMIKHEHIPPVAKKDEEKTADYKNYDGDTNVDTKPVINIKNDQAKLAQKAAKAKMQKFLKPSDNYTAPDKKGNADMLPNIGSDEEKPNYHKPSSEPDGHETAAGVPTTRTPGGADNINDHHVEITDSVGAPSQGIPSATNLNTQYGVITPKVRTDENRTVVVKSTDDFKGDADTPGDATTRGPDADKIDTNKTVTVKDVDKTKDLEDRKVHGQMAVYCLRFSKSFWKSSDGVLAFLANEGIDYSYRIGADGKVINKITEAGGYYEVEALPDEYFVANTYVEHCVASFGGDCAIIAVSGEVKATPEPGHLPYGTKVDTLAVSTKVNTAFITHHVKRVTVLESDLAKATGRLTEIQSILVGVLDDKAKLVDELKTVKAELAEQVAQAKLASRLNAMPHMVRAQFGKGQKADDLLKYMRTASDQEWELARQTFAMANMKGFTELSEEEGKLPVGGGSTNEGKSSLKEYLK